MERGSLEFSYVEYMIHVYPHMCASDNPFLCIYKKLE